MNNQDTTLDKVRFQIWDKRVDASVFSTETLDWYQAVSDLNKTLHLTPYQGPPQNEEEEDGELSVRKKLDLGLISEEDYYASFDNGGYEIPERPKSDWVFTPSVVDMDIIASFHQMPRLLDQTVVYFVGGGFSVYKKPMREIYKAMLDYRELKHGKRDIVEILSKFKESESFDEGQDICG